MDREKDMRDFNAHDDFASDDSLLAPHTKSFVRHDRRTTLLPWLLHLLFFTISASLAIYAWQTHSSLPPEARRFAEYKHKQWTSLFGDTPETFTQTRFDGQFAVSDKYKGPPNAQVDAAWRRLMPGSALKVSKDVFNTFNASRYSVEVPKELGEGYLAYFESVHYVHCVYSLWQSTWPEYYQEQAEFGKKNPETWHLHLDHCADLLRQKLMCDADVGMFGYSWVKNQFGPKANFNVQHQCRDYEQVLEYVDQHQADKGGKHVAAFFRPSDHTVANFVEPPHDPFAEGDADVTT